MTFVNDTRTGFNSTLTYTVDGDKVLKQSGHNVYDPEALDTTAETLKAFVEKLIKDIKASKVLLIASKSKMGRSFKMLKSTSQSQVLTNLEKPYQKNTQA